MPGSCCRDPESGGQVCLPGSWWSEQDHVAGLGQEPTGGQGCDLLPDAGLVVEVEVLQRLDAREPGGADP